MSKFILIVCAMAMFATTAMAMGSPCMEWFSSIAQCQANVLSAGLNRVSTPCKYAQNMLACYPKECCDNPLFNTTEAAINFGAPAGCTAKCGAGAMATPAAALFAVVMSICYRLM